MRRCHCPDHPVGIELPRSTSCDAVSVWWLGGYVVKSIKVVTDAINIVLRNLAQVPDAPEARTLREKAATCLEEAKEWKDKHPSVDQREALMKKVLGLHVAASRLGRGDRP
jgi:hypothetical protein